MIKIPLKKLMKKDAVFFDVFDTLIERDVSVPSEIFKIAGGEEFCESRKHAESLAMQNSPCGEATLEDIYGLLRHDYGRDVDRLMQSELQAELTHCRAKQEVYGVYQQLLAAGKNIYLISDMYLPSRVIAAMLEKCGYGGYKKLYVSNEWGCNKRSGKLFALVLEQNGISPSGAVHVGDSIKGDFIGAIKAGVSPVLIGRKNRFKRFLHL